MFMKKSSFWAFIGLISLVIFIAILPIGIIASLIFENKVLGVVAIILMIFSISTGCISFFSMCTNISKESKQQMLDENESYWQKMNEPCERSSELK